MRIVWSEAKVASERPAACVQVPQQNNVLPIHPGDRQGATARARDKLLFCTQEPPAERIGKERKF